MAGPRQAPEVWERVSDDEVDDASSTTTVLVGADAGAQAWTPSVNGSLRGRHGQGAQRQSVQVNYAEPGDSDWSCSEWSWTWTSESWSSDWSSDPWGQHLDLQRPDGEPVAGLKIGRSYLLDLEAENRKRMGGWKVFHCPGCWEGSLGSKVLLLEKPSRSEDVGLDDNQLYGQILRTNYDKGRVGLEGEDMILRKGVDIEMAAWGDWT